MTKNPLCVDFSDNFKSLILKIIVVNFHGYDGFAEHINMSREKLMDVLKYKTILNAFSIYKISEDFNIDYDFLFNTYLSSCYYFINKKRINKNEKNILLKELDNLKQKFIDLKNNIPNKVNFYYMLDNHTFHKLESDNIDDIVKEAIEVSKKGGVWSYGMLCPPILKNNDKEVRRLDVRVRARPSLEYSQEGLNNWIFEVKNDPDIKRLIKV